MLATITRQLGASRVSPGNLAQARTPELTKMSVTVWHLFVFVHYSRYALVLCASQ